MVSAYLFATVIAISRWTAAKSKSFFVVQNANFMLRLPVFLGFETEDPPGGEEDISMTSVSIAMIISLESSVKDVVMVGIFGAKAAVVRRGLRRGLRRVCTSQSSTVDCTKLT